MLVILSCKYFIIVKVVLAINFVTPNSVGEILNFVIYFYVLVIFNAIVIISFVKSAKSN